MARQRDAIVDVITIAMDFGMVAIAGSVLMNGIEALYSDCKRLQQRKQHLHSINNPTADNANNRGGASFSNWLWASRNTDVNANEQAGSRFASWFRLP
ncbi:MAG: hypothetical protein P1U40_11525 [Coxiellaceae bacterium]|nr:hypothetical protein [Coxiellaceae bacterium]